MSDSSTGENPAQEIPSLRLCMIPESAGFIAKMLHRPAEAAVLTEDAAVMLYELPAGCFTTPVLMPQLRSDSPDTQLLTRCWDFVERIVDHSTQHVGGAVYFEVLDQLLIDSGLVEAAWPYMKERTRDQPGAVGAGVTPGLARARGGRPGRSSASDADPVAPTGDRSGRGGDRGRPLRPVQPRPRSGAHPRTPR